MGLLEGKYKLVLVNIAAGLMENEEEHLWDCVLLQLENGKTDNIVLKEKDWQKNSNVL